MDTLNEKKRKNGNYLTSFDNFLKKTEAIVTVILAVIIVFIVSIALLRILTQTYKLIFLDLFSEQNTTFDAFIDIFAKIMTLLISIEFMKSITKVLRNHGIKSLILDVSLITALSICRKLIIYDYAHSNGLATIAIGVLLIAIGIFYFLIKYDRFQDSQKKNNKSDAEKINE